MGNEYINRESAVAAADYAADEHPYEKLGGASCSEYNEGWNDACDYIREKLENEPAADARPVVHGKWKKASDGDGIVCSECKTDFCTMIYETEKFNFCPNCGARMDGKEPDNEVSKP